MQALLGSWVRIAPFSLLLFSFPACCRCRNEAVAESALPKAATLAGDWQRAYDPAERALPTIGNFRGGVGVSRSDVAAFDSFFAAPFAQGMPSMVSLGLDGRALNVTKHRWAPFEVGRISDDLDSLPRGVSRAESYIRMPVGQPAVLLNVSFYGTGVHNVNLTLTPRIRSYSCIDGWGCTGNPAWCGAGIDKVEQVKCTRAEQFNYSVSQNALHAVDTRSEAATTMSIGTSRGQVATPTLTTRGGEVNLQLTLPGWLTVAVTVAEALASVATEPTTPFAEQWTAAEQDWENQWRQAFSSSDGPVGQLPILETSDLKLSRVYYTSALTLLQLSREGAGVIGGQTWDTAHAAATTGECGGPNQYFWDTSFHAVATSLLQPQAMRTALLATLEANFFDDDWICLQTGCGTSASSQYSKQCFNMIGKYAFNVAALFTSLNEYLRTTGDISFLQLSVAGRTVDDWMERLAFDWKHHLSPQASLLTDYGEDPGEFLECVSTYVGAVPAIQAHIVGMLRQLATIREFQRNQTAATTFRKLADAVATEAEQRLYNRGKGYWSCLYSNGTLQPVAHSLDFSQVGRHMSSTLDPQTKKEMIQWAADELVYGGGEWIRALSLKDPVEGATRPDHGKWGAYAAWPPLVAESFAELTEDFVEMLKILRGAEVVARQGPFGQATQLRPSPGANSTGPPFKTMFGTTMYVADAGGAWVDAVIRTLFGYRPPLCDTRCEGELEAMLWQPRLARGDFHGTLHGVRTPKGAVTINAGPEGLSIVKTHLHLDIENH